MKTVKILSGGYGCKTIGTNTLILKGQTCSVEDGEAEYLVEIGAAVIVNEEPEQPDTKEVSEETPEPDEKPEPALEDLTNKQLEAMCRELGINTRNLTNKSKLINAIREAQEEMPELGAEDFE